MIKRFLIEPPGPVTYLLALLLVFVAAAGIGLWVGWMSASNKGRTVAGPQVPTPKGEVRTEDVPLNLEAPPLMLMASPSTPEEWNVFYGEVELAAKHGLHRYAVPVKLAWREPWSEVSLIEHLTGVLQRDPEAVFMLEVDLNPTPEWLDAHPEATVQMPGQTSRFASPFSLAWHTAATQEALYLVQAIKASPLGRRVQGCILSAMHEGSWRFEAGYDSSLASEAALEKWLVTRYGSPEKAAEAWKVDTLPRPLTPPYPNTADGENVFFKFPEEIRYLDYLRFVSESVADTLARIAGEFREKLGDEVELLARYGYVLESESNAAGHFALGNLLNSELDGFITPVSYASRGSGSTGGPMAPIHSGRLHGKVWYLLDDTRTGVSRDALTGAISRIEGLRAEDVYTVQERNFALALTQGMGLIWADPHAQGWLHDEPQWEKFRELAELYCQTWPEFRLTLEDETPKKEEPKPEPEPKPESEPAPPLVPSDTEGAIEGYLKPKVDRLALQVVVDEESRFYQRFDAGLNNALILEGRDAALMSGVPGEFVLLDDVIEERTPEASVYLMLNAFHLSIEERERLQARFTEEQASVIWLYAPGYFRDEPRTDHVSTTARITVEPFEKPERAGSRMAIDGRWIRQNETFGYRGVLAPLFYINDNDADVIALFEGSNKPSAAFKTLPEGWTSVLVTEAGMAPQLLREILHILEQHTYFQTTNGRYVDTTYFGEGLMAIHARQVGERAVDLGDYFNVTDLLDPTLGWPERDSFLIQLNHGETRLMKLEGL